METIFCTAQSFISMERYHTIQSLQSYFVRYTNCAIFGSVYDGSETAERSLGGQPYGAVAIAKCVENTMDVFPPLARFSAMPESGEKILFVYVYLRVLIFSSRKTDQSERNGFCAEFS